MGYRRYASQLKDQACALVIEEQYDPAVAGRPTDRTYWLIVARNVETGEVKYFVSNAPPRTALLTLLKVAFSRWGVEVFHPYCLHCHSLYHPAFGRVSGGWGRVRSAA